ncbi:taste receptor type 2 member 1 [Trichosurus vulpecula]|uniref:taste receptor type 2 member 1 n=1 Tax=Trichosurus vulpecula TaxID=9337 RepID=UPI00186ADD04|nr:taste receptor type 2 member 1 [Trichosurus vulpecula]
MTAPLLIIQVIYGIAQFLVGIIANGIIIIVSGLEYTKRKRVTAYDLLLTNLGIFRILLELIIVVCNLSFFFTLQLHVDRAIFIFFFFINEVNLWLATNLCVFYCVKIANIFHPFFLWLKMRISRLVPWLILGSLLFSAAISVLHGLLYWPRTIQDLRRFWAGNITVQVLFQCLLPTPILLVGLIIPFYIFIAASFLLIHSLCRHTRQMRSTATGFRDASTEAHIHALKSVFSFLILFSSYYVGMTIIVYRVNIERGFLLFVILSVASLYPSVHSIILILGNSKLKNYIRKFLLSAKYCLGGGSALDSTQTQ